MKNQGYKEYEIKSNEEVSQGIYLLTLYGTSSGEAGQFYMLREKELTSRILSRPISIYNIDRNKNEISFLYRIKGEGTKSFSKKKKGEKILALGPLGNPYPIFEGKIAIIGGGIGIAPLNYLAKSLNSKADIYLGFRDIPYMLEEFYRYSNKLIITSDMDEGYVNTHIVDQVDYSLYDYIYTCGPEALIKSVIKNSDKAEIYASLEKEMACGIGACLGCTIETTKGMKRVCNEGPIFRGEDLII